MRLEGPKANFAPNNEGSSDGTSEYVDEKAVYRSTLQEYVKTRKELSEFKRGFGENRTDPDVQRKMNAIDQRLHEQHQELDRIANGIGKGSSEVIADMLRADGNLSWLGLPEFSILTSDDLISYSGDHLAYGYDFVPRHGQSQAPTELPIGRGFSDTLSTDKLMIVFDVVAYSGDLNNQEKYAVINPQARTRVHRAHALAEVVGGTFSTLQDGDSFHTHRVTVKGIVIPVSELERVASIIRHDADKYRIDGAHITGEERNEAEKEYREFVYNVFNTLSSFTNEKMAQKKIRGFLADVLRIQGQDVYVKTKEMYEEWQRTT